jgi:hypothetical protein
MLTAHPFSLTFLLPSLLWPKKKKGNFWFTPSKQQKKKQNISLFGPIYMTRDKLLLLSTQTTRDHHSSSCLGRPKQ